MHCVGRLLLLCYVGTSTAASPAGKTPATMPAAAAAAVPVLQPTASAGVRCPPAAGNYSVLASKGHLLKPPFRNFSCASMWNHTLTEPTSGMYLSGLGPVTAHSADSTDTVVAAWGFCNNGDYDAHQDYCNGQFKTPLHTGIVGSEGRGCVMRTGTLRDLAALTRANWSAFRIGDEMGNDPFCMKPPCYSDTNCESQTVPEQFTLSLILVCGAA